jgi:hypothetical protein
MAWISRLPPPPMEAAFADTSVTLHSMVFLDTCSPRKKASSMSLFWYWELMSRKRSFGK